MSSNNNPTESTPVLIVGAGPAGMIEALALARVGIRSTLLTLYPYTAHTPRAHVINPRTMEIFRTLGIEDDVVAVADTADYMENNVWVTTMAGTEVARISSWGTGHERQKYTDASPSNMCNYPQHLLEPIIMKAVVETGLVDVRFGHEYLDHGQDEHGVVSRIKVCESGHEYSVSSSYLIGADGGRSRILDQLGIKHEGVQNAGRVLFVWIEADLSRYVQHRPGILYHSVIPDGRVGLILVRPWNEWIAGAPVDDSFDHTDHNAVLALIRKFIGDETIPVRIKHVSPWSVNGCSAPQYSQGRVFCMGDAVHRHAPWNGLGLNTAVADAFNLAWKLKLVLEGTAAPLLLDSYDAERVPVGRQVIRRVGETTAQMINVPASIGNHPGIPVSEMLRNAETLFDDTTTAAQRRENLDAALTPLSTTGFNALGAEIGYRYRTGAIFADGTCEPLPDGDPDHAYRATTWPGARLPHAWLETGRRRISTLDIVNPAAFTLIVGIESSAWRDAVAKLPHALASAVEVVQVGGSYGVRDIYGDWRRIREVGDSGAVLARPDHHVAWRAADGTGAQQLGEVLGRLLGTMDRQPLLVAAQHGIAKPKHALPAITQ
ncbi:2,4-dichlorophenol 6-monooxygenase [Pseudomonas sp. CYM-20-01]|uniref:FAD-dependent monooxygenase n=1 Tax=Pseudomonas sp. CYM-20-01 TaxID=2870750 RepID=UPI0020673F09|nr:FAD-dependent monooxygenase [Pseudomonas sp. CYM-20-01]BDB20772.1 2,4-dichlorophenol 6-monooxygenase [Pseudomonas sp. CYM-20-01]